MMKVEEGNKQAAAAKTEGRGTMPSLTTEQPTKTLPDRLPRGFFSEEPGPMAVRKSAGAAAASGRLSSRKGPEAGPGDLWRRGMLAAAVAAAAMVSNLIVVVGAGAAAEWAARVIRVVAAKMAEYWRRLRQKKLALSLRPWRPQRPQPPAARCLHVKDQPGSVLEPIQGGLTTPLTSSRPWASRSAAGSNAHPPPPGPASATSSSADSHPPALSVQEDATTTNTYSHHPRALPERSPGVKATSRVSRIRNIPEESHQGGSSMPLEGFVQLVDLSRASAAVTEASGVASPAPQAARTSAATPPPSTMTAAGAPAGPTSTTPKKDDSSGEYGVATTVTTIPASMMSVSTAKNVPGPLLVVLAAAALLSTGPGPPPPPPAVAPPPPVAAQSLCRSKIRTQRLSESTARTGAGLIKAQRARAAALAKERGAGRPPRRRGMRRAMILAVGGPLGFVGGRELIDKWSALCDLGSEAGAGLHSFFSRQLYDPCKAIINQIFFRQKPRLMDQNALEDAQVSLQNMLQLFLEDHSNGITKEERAQSALAMDMSAVSRELEKASPKALRATVTGKIPRILLIQVAFMKKELLQAMGAIDDLYSTNQVTLQVIAAVPAAVLGFLAYHLARSALHVAFSRRLEPTRMVHAAMRQSVREMERLLVSSRGFVGAQESPAAILPPPAPVPEHVLESMGMAGTVEDQGQGGRQGQGLFSPVLLDAPSPLGSRGPWAGAKQGSQEEGAVDTEKKLEERGAVVELGVSCNANNVLESSTLNLEETGRLTVCLHHLQTLVRQNAPRFDTRTRRGIEEDLRDMTLGKVTVKQQLAVLERMRRSYAFLPAEGGSG
ncbi:unnamed protein product [Discosporangium mesarthrocarpum]